MNRRRVLVVEDEMLVAADLAAAVHEADGEVLGPVGTVDEALALLSVEVIDAAILDVRLSDRDVAPVARALLVRGAVVVFHSASEIPAEIAGEFGGQHSCPKPAAASSVVRLLATVIAAPR